jgi:hypothetical protein
LRGSHGFGSALQRKCNADDQTRADARRLGAIGYDLAGYWELLTYHLTNGGDKSNVNIAIFEGNTLKWRYNSPDNREPGISYHLEPRLGSNGTWHDPNGTRVVRSYGTRVQFVAIFDKSWGDPSCTAITEVARD